MKPELVLVRILRRSAASNRASTPNSPSTYHPASPAERAGRAWTAQWDANNPFHLAVLESSGILQAYVLETQEGKTSAYLYPCATFQLHLSFGSSQEVLLDDPSQCSNGWKQGLKPIKQPWGSFEFIPGRSSEILFFQAESNRLLFAQLPGPSGRPHRFGLNATEGMDDENFVNKATKVYCVGRHSSSILSVAVRQDGLAVTSAARDGSLRVWRLSDGAMIAQTSFARWTMSHSRLSCKKCPDSQNEHECGDGACANVLSWYGKFWKVLLGCPNGEVRIWAMSSMPAGPPLQGLKLEESASLFSDQIPISALALFSPDENFPYKQDGNSSPRLRTLTMERLTIGTSEGRLQVWSEKKGSSDWFPLWGATVSLEGASIVCLSYRTDGGLLAVGASFLSKPIVKGSSPSKMPSMQSMEYVERVYLYETFAWECVGSLSFQSQLGSCLFYRPVFTRKDLEDPGDTLSREKVSSCRVLLVSTQTGPQAHILPEHGLFGDISKVNKKACSHSQHSRKEHKRVQWADLKLFSKEESKDKRRGMDSLERTCITPRQLGASCDRDRHTNSNISSAVSERAQAIILPDNHNNSKSEIESSKFRVQDLQPCKESEKFKKTVVCPTAPYSQWRHPGRPKAVKLDKSRSLRETSSQDIQEKTGVPSHIVERFKSGIRVFPPRIKSRTCICCSKKSQVEKMQAIPTVLNTTAVEPTVKINSDRYLPAFSPSGHNASDHLSSPFQSERKNERAARSMSPSRDLVTQLGSRGYLEDKEIPNGCHESTSTCGNEQQSCRYQNPSCHKEMATESDHLRCEELNACSYPREGAFLRRSCSAMCRLQENHPSVQLSRPHSANCSRWDVPGFCSTTKLIERFQDVQNETFSVKAALEIAHKRGIQLNKEAKFELRKAFREESMKKKKINDLVNLNKNDSAEDGAQVRHWHSNTPKMKKLSPAVTPRKVKRQVYSNREDCQRIKPSMGDLWDVLERCPQVCPTAHLDCVSMRHLWASEGNEGPWTPREASCRAALSAMTVYDSCHP